MTVDDGAHHATITSTVDATNDGAFHRVVCERDVAAGNLRMWTYRSDGSLTETVTAVADPTTIAAGSLWNGTEPTYLCRYGNTTAGSMTQNITFDFFRYVKKALAITQFAAIPSVAPAPEQLPLPGPATPDTVAPSNLQLWLFDSRGGYSERTRLGSSPTPTNPPPGYGADFLVDSSGHGYYTSTVTMPIWRGVDPNVGGYWTVPGTLNPKVLDSRSIGQFDYISRFSSAWTIGGMFQIPSTHATTQQFLLTNMDSQYGFSIATNYAGTPRFWFEARNEKGDFIEEITDPGGGVYATDTWYYFALVFNGSGGFLAKGLTAYLIPLTGAQLSLSDVTRDKSLSLDNGVDVGNTLAATIGSTAPLKIARGANSETLITDLAVWNSALTDADILTLANGRVAKLTATIDGDGTLELAGPDSAISGRNGRANIVNTSSAAVGLLVSGPNELVGGIDGTGNVVVNAGGSLTASHIVQNTLAIGGAATSGGRVTLEASDTQGRPSAVAMSTSDGTAAMGSIADLGSVAAAPSTATGSAGAVSADIVGRSPAFAPDPSSTRPVAREGLVVPNGPATVEIPLTQAIDDRAPIRPDSGSSDRSEDASNTVSLATQRTSPPGDRPTSFIENADVLRLSSPPLLSALDSALGDFDSRMATIDPTLDLLVGAWRRSQVS
jgi:hypothetical protein